MSKLESAIQRDVKDYLESKQWLVEVFSCNAYQRGIPDLLAFQDGYGFRFIDVKRPKGGTLTKAQVQKWSKWDEYGLGVWIMTAPTEAEHRKLFEPPNWRNWWKPRYEKYLKTPVDIIRELNSQK